MKKIAILFIMLAVLSQANPAKEVKKPVKKGKAAAAAKAEEKLFSGYFAKFGLMTSPPASFGDKWLLDGGRDWGINPYLSVGGEIQPYYRHFSDSQLSDSTLGANLFANAKGGVNIGRFVEKLNFLTPYIGFGLGVALASSSSTFDGEKVSRASFNFAWHLMFGFEVALKKMRLMLELQTIKVSVPGISPDAAQHFLMLGVRF
jgi:opacity protein-like surface antigen